MKGAYAILTSECNRTLGRHSRECGSLVKTLDSRIRGNDNTLQVVGTEFQEIK